MIVDAFTHIYPAEYVKYIQRLDRPLPVFFQDAPHFVEAEAKLAEMDRNNIDVQVLALGTPAFDELFGPDQAGGARDAARTANDGIAAVVAKHPDRFVGVATLPLVGPASLDAALDEFDRAVRHLHMKGVQLYTNVAGAPLDRAEFLPLYEKAVEYDLPILLHPTGGQDNPQARDYLLWLTFGWPFETSLAMARLAYSGVLERFPQLKILTHHLGAFVPHTAERIKGVTCTLERTSGWKLPRPILTYFKQFYGDTAVNGHRPALDSGYEFFGASHILFATDYPFVSVAPTLKSILEWELPEDEKALILGGNARSLFRL